MKKKFFVSVLAVILSAVTLLSLSGCGISATNLMADISPVSVTSRKSDNQFANSYADFALKIFKKAWNNEDNDLLSPLSVMVALAMTANGADGQTREEMQTLLGGDISIERLNEYLYTYISNLPSADKYKVELANSIWFRDDEDRLKVEPSFLQTNADYFAAAAYKAPFNDKTLKDINNWVDENTDGMIKKILDNISADDVMYLINALVFEAEWQTVYEKDNVIKGKFRSLSGENQDVKMMYSSESTYIKGDNESGFVKYYKDGKYAFAALLPNENVSIGDYIQTLDGEEFLSLIGGAKSAVVSVAVPKFSYEYEIDMNQMLIDLGMPTAFSSGAADFSKMATSSRGNIYIGLVKHKTFITVDEKGTKAGAVTLVGMKDSACPGEIYQVYLDRPFVYALIDCETSLPLFIGSVVDLS